MPGLLLWRGIRGAQVCRRRLSVVAVQDWQQSLSRQEGNCRMREFSKISPAVWHSPRFNSLPSDDGRYLYLYLLSSPHQTSAGAYHLPEGYACADLGWSQKRYREARETLIEADLIS